jgi:hypothetical protein
VPGAETIPKWVVSVLDTDDGEPWWYSPEAPTPFEAAIATLKHRKPKEREPIINVWPSEPVEQVER